VRPGSLSAVIRSFKAAATAEARRAGHLGPDPLWQRNYHEHVIRNERDLAHIREYIRLNPLRWAQDAENPDRREDAVYDREWGWIEARTATPRAL
jgi:hypothetical protein